MSRLDSILELNTRDGDYFDPAKAKRELKTLLLELIEEALFAGELDNGGDERRHPNGIIDPVLLRKKVKEL